MSRVVARSLTRLLGSLAVAAVLATSFPLASEAATSSPRRSDVTAIKHFFHQWNREWDKTSKDPSHRAPIRFIWSHEAPETIISYSQFEACFFDSSTAKFTQWQMLGHFDSVKKATSYSFRATNRTVYANIGKVFTGSVYKIPVTNVVRLNSGARTYVEPSSIHLYVANGTAYTFTNYRCPHVKAPAIK